MENSATDNSYESLLAILEADNQLAVRQAAAAQMAQLIEKDDYPPATLKHRLNALYAGVADVRLATDLLKAKNSILLKEKGFERPLRNARPGLGIHPDITAALDRLRQLHDAGKPQDSALDACYHIESLISEGGMGRIFKGTRRSDNLPVAIKFLSEMFVGSENARQRFEREYRLLASLEHPNIVKVIDYGADSRRCFIVMEYISGGDLALRVNRGDIDISRILPIFTQVCAGLQAVHEKGIVHRDIKPSNILINEDGVEITPLLTDFGLARNTAEDGLTRSSCKMGTMAFSSPEQIVDPRSVGPAGDIYSLGVTMYFAFSGGQTPSGDYPDLERFDPRVPPAMNRIIEKCLQRRPADRWPSAAALSEALQMAGDRTELLQA